MAGLALAGALLAGPMAASAAERLPAGVTVKEIDEGLVLASPKGELLYRLDLDRIAKRRRDAGEGLKARCADTCDRLWKPVAAPKDFKAEGDWGVVQRDWGAQLAYKGDALYTFVGESLKQAESLQVVPPYFTSYSAKPTAMIDGVPVATLYWHAALYEPPAPKVVTPAGVGVSWAKTAHVFIAPKKHVLYVRKSGRACEQDCAGMQPLAAPLAAQPVGEWRPVEVDGGGRAWAYKGRVVYQSSAAADGEPSAQWERLRAG